jgi:hypothetical protein
MAEALQGQKIVFKALLDQTHVRILRGRSPGIGSKGVQISMKQTGEGMSNPVSARSGNTNDNRNNISNRINNNCRFPWLCNKNMTV